MKKRRPFVIGLLLFLMGGVTHAAVVSDSTVTNYSEAFSASPNDASYDLSYPYLGWSRISDSGQSISYSRNSSGFGTSSVQNSGRMNLVVTPKLSGTVTLKVQKYANSSRYTSSIEFYKVKEVDGQLVVGEKIDATVPELTPSKQSVTIPVDADGTRIGIRMSYVYIDDLQADKAVLSLVSGLRINSFSWNQSRAGYLATQALVGADDSIKVAYNLTLRNIGDVNLTPNMENYSVTVYDPLTNKDVFTVPVDKTINHNSTASSMVIEGKVAYAEHPSQFRLYVRENLTGTEYFSNSSSQQITPIDPNPKMVLKRGTYSSADTLKNGDTVYFSTNPNNYVPRASADINPAFKTYRLYNTGGSTLRISNLTATDGFTASLPVDTIRSVSGYQDLTIRIDTTTAGKKTGTLTFTTNEKGNPTYSYELTGLIVDSTAYFEGFLLYKLPDEIINENNHWEFTGNSNFIPQYEGNNAAMGTTYSSTMEKTGKAITPLLNVDSRGITFSAAPINYMYNGRVSYLTVYYSKDRKNWTAAKTISTTDGTLPVDSFLPPRSAWQYMYTDFTVTDIPAGQYYIGFDGKNVKVDDIICYGGRVSLKHDIILVSQSVPATGKINREYNANIEVKNTLGPDEKNVKVKFVLGDKVVETRTDTIEGYQQKKYHFSLYPETAGTYKAYISIDFGDNYIVSTDSVDLVIAPEDGSRSVSTAEVATTDSKAPVDVSSLYTESEVIYAPEQIKISKGDVIKGITFKGVTGASNNANNDVADFKFNVKVWLNQIDSNKIVNNGDVLPDTLAMTKVYDGVNTFTKGGKLGTTWNSALGSYLVEESADALKIIFDKPVTYNGGYLDFVFKGNIIGQDYANGIVYYVTDVSDKEHAIERSASTEEYLNSGRFSAVGLPVAYLDVESKVATVSGTITNRKTGDALDSVAVTLTHGGIVYSDTTDAKGNYSIKVYETNFDYDVEVNKTGFYPVYESMNVAGDTVRNYRLNASGTLYMESSSIPTTGQVNHKMTAKAVGVNYNQKPAADYTATLYVNGEAVANGTPHDTIAANAKSEFTFAYTPHANGTFPAYIEFATGDNTYSSDTVQIVISPENPIGIAQVGDSTDISNSNTPAHLGDKNSQTETIYTAEQIGLAEGTVITKLFYKSFCGSSKTINSHIVVWMENVDENTVIPTSGTITAGDTTKMTKVWDGNKHFQTMHGTRQAPDTLYTFSFDKPFIYGGKNLRVVVHTYSDNWVSPFYFVSGNGGRSIYRSNDNYTNMLSRSFNTHGLIPVAYLEYQSPRLFGVVRKVDNTAVAGATVRAQSGDVVYTTTTDENGAYSLNVVQGKLNYIATASAEGCLTDSVYDVDFPAGDVEQDFTLYDIPTLSGAVVDGTDSVAGAIVTLTSGDVVLTDTTDAKGLYSIAVQNPQLTYTANIAAKGYLPSTVGEINVAIEGTKKDFAIRKIPTVSGTVKSDTVVIAGASVTLKADTVVYTATTDTAGAYSISVPNIDLTFTATVSAEGYLADSVAGISVAKNDTVVNFNLRPVPTISGVVTNGTDSISGATITLKSGDVVYTATTDVHGTYSIKVPEASLTYVATATADEYEPDSVANITFEKGDTVVNFVLSYAPIEVTIPASGWTSFSNVHAVSIPEGVKAYTVVDMTADYAQLKETTSIAAGEGVILQGVAGTYQFPVVQNVANAKDEAAEVNLLVGTAAADYTVDNASVGKVLTFTDANSAAGFQKAAAGDVVAQGHAYLRAKNGITVKDYLTAGTITTGINGITANGTLDTSKPMYNLGGARVSKSYRGVVIQNGKKYVK